MLWVSKKERLDKNIQTQISFQTVLQQPNKKEMLTLLKT